MKNTLGMKKSISEWHRQEEKQSYGWAEFCYIQKNGVIFWTS